MSIFVVHPNPWNKLNNIHVSEEKRKPSSLYIKNQVKTVMRSTYPTYFT